jgi:hypothetical protein
MNFQQRKRAAHANRRKKAVDFGTSSSFNFGANATKSASHSGKAKGTGRGRGSWGAYTSGSSAPIPD